MTAADAAAVCRDVAVRLGSQSVTRAAERAARARTEKGKRAALVDLGQALVTEAARVAAVPGAYDADPAAFLCSLAAAASAVADALTGGAK